MRALRPLARIDARRAAYRRRYATYMASPAWWRRRERWYRDETLRTGHEPRCAICDRDWALTSGDLHHTSYDNLGHEHHTDLVAMCRSCHELLHQILGTSKHWQRLDRASSSAELITILRRHHTSGGDHSEGDHL